CLLFCFFFQAEDGIRDFHVTGVQTCALPISAALRGFIDSELRASFDREYAARLVLGPHGRGADAADITLFADAMTDNLMQRYGSALLAFDGRPRIRLKSETPLPNNRGVRVSTEILRDGGDPIPV